MGHVVITVKKPIGGFMVYVVAAAAGPGCKQSGSSCCGAGGASRDPQGSLYMYIYIYIHIYVYICGSLRTPSGS